MNLFTWNIPSLNFDVTIVKKIQPPPTDVELGIKPLWYFILIQKTIFPYLGNITLPN